MYISLLAKSHKSSSRRNTTPMRIEERESLRTEAPSVHEGTLNRFGKVGVPITVCWVSLYSYPNVRNACCVASCTFPACAAAWVQSHLLYGIVEREASMLQELLAGGVAGACGKSSVAPLERVKILIQVCNHPTLSWMDLWLEIRVFAGVPVQWAFHYHYAQSIPVSFVVQTGRSPSTHLGVVLRYLVKTDGIQGLYRYYY